MIGAGMKLVRLFETKRIVEVELAVHRGDVSGVIDPNRAVVNPIGDGSGFINCCNRGDLGHFRGGTKLPNKRTLEGFGEPGKLDRSLTRR